MDIGNAYAKSYNNVYSSMKDARYEDMVLVAAEIRRIKDAEPVGTETWHGCIGGLTALGVLSGRNL